MVGKDGAEGDDEGEEADNGRDHDNVSARAGGQERGVFVAHAVVAWRLLNPLLPRTGRERGEGES